MDKGLSFALLKHVQELSENGKNDEAGVAVDCLSNALKVSLNSEEDKSKYAVDKSLLEIFEAGCKSLNLTLGQPTSSSTADADSASKSEGSEVDLESLPHFKKYFAKVEEKGFFKGCEPGSDEYVQRYDKLTAKYKEKFGDVIAQHIAAKEQENKKASAQENDDKEGDRLKALGNEALKQKDYAKAVEYYTQAIEAAPCGVSSHIYYSNRAAAYLHMQDYEKAAEDCSVSTTLCPGYAKSHARAAQANLKLGQTADATASANRALEIEPGNVTAKEVLKQLGGSAAAPSSGDAMGGMAGLGGMGGLASMMQGMDPSTMEQLAGLRNQMASGGGMPDMASLMSNPGMMDMAQKMMQNPQMMEMANKMAQNPDEMAKMMNMFGGGGMPPQ